MISELMSKLSQDLELDNPLRPEDDGVYRWPLNDSTDVLISQRQEDFLFFCNAGPVPKNRQEEILTKAMVCDLFCQATNGAIIGLDQEGKQFIISNTLPLNIDHQQFKNELEDFLNLVDIWQDEIKE